MAGKGNPDGLRSAAEQKKNKALEQTNLAISQMVKSGKKINFHTVAQTAGVSVAYLYKHDTLKQRINQLRKQQSNIKDLPQNKSATDDSKKAIITALKERIKKQDAEIRGLRDHIEVIQGIAMQVTDTHRLNEALQIENSKLREQLSECQAQQAHNVKHQLDNPKVICLENRQSISISDRIKSDLSSLGIRLNATLTKKILAAPEQTVISAIESLKAAIASSGPVKNKAGFLVRAIEEAWVPHENDQELSELDTFNEWYDLAKKRGVALASQRGKDGIEIYTNGEKWVSFQEMLNLYPVETLLSK